MVQYDECRKEKNKEPIVEQQWIFGVVQELLQKRLQVKRRHTVNFIYWLRHIYYNLSSGH